MGEEYVWCGCRSTSIILSLWSLVIFLIESIHEFRTHSASNSQGISLIISAAFRVNPIIYVQSSAIKLYHLMKNKENFRSISAHIRSIFDPPLRMKLAVPCPGGAHFQFLHIYQCKLIWNCWRNRWLLLSCCSFARGENPEEIPE